MPRNIEIKARMRDPEATTSAVRALAEAAPQQIAQEDTFFHSPAGRLKLRTLTEDRGQLIYYERADTPTPKESHYLVAPTSDPVALERVLASALGIRGRVRKQRTLYLAGQTRIHLDQVDGLGAFLELEVVLAPGQSTGEGQDVAEALMGRLGIEPDDLLEGAYIDLLEQGAA